MNEETAKPKADDGAEKKPKPDPEAEKAERKARSERMTQIMWAYVCAGIALLCNVVGLEATFIPLGFGVLGGILAWQLSQKNERRNSLITGALNLGAILIWLTYNWPTIQHYLGLGG
jgi:hypothetical protein